MNAYLRVPTYCRHCDRRSVMLTRPCNLTERLLGMALVYPYRCHQCDRRFWRIGRRTQERTRVRKVVAVLVGLLLVAGIVCTLLVAQH